MSTSGAFVVVDKRILKKDWFMRDCSCSNASLTVSS